VSTTTPTPPASAARRIRQPTLLGGFGLLATLFALTLTVGPLGLLGGVIFTLAALFVSPVVGFALGQAILLALLPTPTLAQLALVQAALFLVLLDPVGTDPTTAFESGSLAVVLLVISGVAVWLAADIFGLLETAAGLTLVLAFVSYAIHRYEQVSLGLAGGDP
jgi:hypothetical protein